MSPELLGYGRDPQAPIRDAVNVDGDVVIPMDAENLGFWLKAIFGQPTTTGTTPRTHTFQSGGFTLPSMAIETQMPDVPRFAMYSGLVADRIQWQSQRSGLLTATVSLIGRGETLAATTAAGTQVEYTSDDQACAADGIKALPEGAVLVSMLSDYAALRDQTRACSQNPGCATPPREAPDATTGAHRRVRTEDSWFQSAAGEIRCTWIVADPTRHVLPGNGNMCTPLIG